MGAKFDLLGHPIPDGRGQPGRTGHIPTPENASKIRTLLVAGLPVSRIAEELGISAPTLRKHYFHNGKVNLRHAQEMARAEARAKNLLQLQSAADDGNVSAMKEIRKVLDRADLLALDDDVARGGANDSRAEAKGKKDLARRAALDAEDELTDLLLREERIN